MFDILVTKTADFLEVPYSRVWQQTLEIGDMGMYRKYL